MVGKKVICIDSEHSDKQLEWFSKNNIMFPSKGETYTVRSVVEVFSSENKVFIRLNEIINPQIEIFPRIILEPSFPIEKFQILN